MEVLKARAGMLSHYEVLQHVLSQKADNDALLSAGHNLRAKHRAINDQDQDALDALPLRTPKEMQLDKELNVRGVSDDLVYITDSLQTYLNSYWSPTPRQTPHGIKSLLHLLKQHDLTKAEQWQLVNYCPNDVIGLYVIVEEIEARILEHLYPDLVEQIQSTLLPAPEVPAEEPQAMEIDPEEAMNEMYDEEEMGMNMGEGEYVDEGKWGGGGVEDEGDGEIDG